MASLQRNPTKAKKLAPASKEIGGRKKPANQKQIQNGVQDVLASARKPVERHTGGEAADMKGARNLGQSR